ncbi:MAG: PEP-CTERM sorting domain-containing protein [Planctomycetota bacterium]
MKSSVIATLSAGLMALATFAAAPAWAVGWDNDDFIVAGNQLFVYDSDFTFKGELETDPRQRPIGLDLDLAGNLIAGSPGLGSLSQVSQVTVFQPNGEIVPEASFTNADLGTVLDIKVGPNGHYYAGTQLAGQSGERRSVQGLVEFLPDGTTGTEFLSPVGGGGRGSGGLASRDYDSVAVLPNGTVWSGGFTSSAGGEGWLDAFDINTGAHLGPIELDNGQTRATTMRYSPTTNTVLLVDSNTGVGFERALDGIFIRSFTHPTDPLAFSITRGPNNDVYIASNDPSVTRIDRFLADGTFVDSFNASPASVTNILWTGNPPIPEPATLALAATGLALITLRRHRSTATRSR